MLNETDLINIKTRQEGKTRGWEDFTQRGGRRTGYSFRAILRSLLSASEGKTVWFVAYDRNSCLHSFRRMTDILSSQLSADFYSLDSARLQIVFRNGGSLKFKDLSDRFEGSQQEVVVEHDR